MSKHDSSCEKKDGLHEFCQVSKAWGMHCHLDDMTNLCLSCNEFKQTHKNVIGADLGWNAELKVLSLAFFWKVITMLHAQNMTPCVKDGLSKKT